METYAKAPSTKRFVIEDSITKVTSDGEPHELMTMVAGLSGLLAAVAILAVLVSMVGCRKSKSIQAKRAAAAAATLSYATDQSPRNDSMTSADSTALTMTMTLTMPTRHEHDAPAISATSTNHGRRLSGNLNAAFIGSELSLCSDALSSSGSRSGSACSGRCDGKHGKQSRQKNWQAAVKAEGQRRETYIQVERY